VGTLRRLEAEEWEHLAHYHLVSTPSTIVVKAPSGQLLDLEHQPGTVLEDVLMADVLQPFHTREGAAVPAMQAPRPHLVIDPHLLGGYPASAGSRVPFDLVAGLADEGTTPSEIIQMFPSVSKRAIPDARDFAHQMARVAA
jgi:uncharacterized protein (DUF433 family)